MADISVIAGRVDDLKQAYARRDTESELLRWVRTGDWEKIAPGAFTEDYKRPVTANRIDVMARDYASSLAPLPSISCAAASSTSDTAKKFAAKRTKIANYYIGHANLEAHQTDAADSYNYYGMLVYFVEPDVKDLMPTPRVRSGANVYAVWDRTGDTVLAAEEWEVTRLALREQFPDLAPKLDSARHHPGQYGADKLRVIRYSDRHETVMYLPELGNEVLVRFDAPIPGKSQYVCVPRPNGSGESFTSVPRGAYVDLIYAQIARHDVTMQMMESAFKAVNAPTVVPTDVTSVPYGPDAVIPTQNPQGVQKLRMDVPSAAFQAMQVLDEDIAIGGMSPEARTGNIQASVITGKGVEAATAGYSSQVANAQMMIKFGLRLVIERCFAMDEHLWPNTRKKIRGIENGVPFIGSYTPSKDIAGDHSVDITYGFMLGMAPNNALVFLLQASAAGLISKDFAARQLPVGINPTEEQQKIDLEQMRNTLLQSLASLAQAVPQFVVNGQDPTAIITAIAEVTRRIQKGDAIEDIMVDVFVPEPAPPPPGLSASGGSAAAEGAAGSDGGGASLRAVAERGANPLLGPGDRPDLAQFFSGMSAEGNAVLTGGVSRMDPIVG